MRKKGLFIFSLLLFTSAATAAELPAGYTAVNHIVASRGAYIDTLYKPNQNTRVEMDVTVQSAGEYWFGVWDEDYDQGVFAFGNDGSGVCAGYGNQGGTFGSVVANGRHTVELDKNVVKVDGGTTYERLFDANFGREGPLVNNLYLFAQNRKGTPAVAGLQASIICHGCKIYESGVRVRDFVPCVASNGRTGLYDLVEQRFYSLHLRSLPSGYRAVDHIIVPRGAYIDTEYKPNQNTRTMMDVTVQGKAEYWFSVSGANYTTDAYALCNDDWLGIYYAVDDDGGSFKSAKTADGCVPNGRHTVGITPYSFLVDDGVWGMKDQRGDFQLENNLYLFASHAAAVHEAYTPTTQTTIICHGCLISESGTPVRDFVPCVRTADAVAGLYDTVEGKFYENFGLGIIGVSDDASSFGRELTSGTYEFAESFAFVAPPGESALKIADGAIVTLNIPWGVTVTVRGGDATGTTGAGAGIEVPANATLQVTGEGKLVAYGGKAANGANGANGGNGSADNSAGNFTSGAGGAGGNGGGGAGAGIGGRGGNGGTGGAGGASVSSFNWTHEDIAGNIGGYGGNGGDGGTCGTVSVEGLVMVMACGGAGGLDGAGGAAGTRSWGEGSTYWFCAFGGGGGGSGAKGGTAQDVGGGGAGGFGGSGGGSGAYVWGRESTVDTYPGWGHGGRGAADGAAGGESGILIVPAGLPGARGGSGSLTVAESATILAGEQGCYTVGRISDTEFIRWEMGQLYRVVDGARTALSYSVVGSGTSSFGSGWYVVKGMVSCTNRILVSGAANLVLLHGSSLTVDCRGITDQKEYAPGIEVCDDNSLCVFGVESGSLTALGSVGAAGIGTAWRYGGVWNCNSCGSMAFYGGTVTAQGGEYGAGIGGGHHGAGGTVTINGGTVTAFGADGGAGIGGGYGGAGGSLTLRPCVYKIDDNHWREGVTVSLVVPNDLRVSSSVGADRTWMEGNRYFAVNREPDHTVTFAFEVTDPAYRLVGNAFLAVGPVIHNCELETSQLPYAEEIVLDTLDYALPNGEPGRARNVYPIHNHAEVSVLSQSWYRATGSLSCSELTVVGEINLILCDGVNLTVNGGIRVGEGNTLNIFCQEGGTGRLVADGSDDCAGIGGNLYVAGGTVTINGGTVTANGGKCGAGIGGGNQGAGGAVTINGGTVTATGGMSGAGIGGGNRKGGGKVTVNGGVVTAAGGDRGAGIGGGMNGAGGTVMVNGGTVTATGNDDGAGIGGGHGGAGGKVTLDETKVEVVEGAYGNGNGHVKIEPITDVWKAEVETFDENWYVVAPRDTYVNTHFKPGSNTRVTMDVKVQSTSEYWFGCWTNNWDNGAFALGNDGDSVYCGYGSGETCGGIPGIIPSGRVTVALEKGVVYTNGVVWSDGHMDSNTVFSLDRRLYLFAQNRAGAAQPGGGQDRIVCYGCKIWTNGVDGATVPVRNFIPARTKDERQIVGLYDTVSGEFYAPRVGSLTLGCDEDADPVCEGGTIEWSDAADAWVVSPTNGVTAVTVTGLPEGAKLAVKSGDYAVPSAAFAGFGEGKTEGVFSLALNPEGVVTIGDKEIRVAPTVGALDDGEPFTVGEGGVTVTIKAIPGLKYALKRTDSLRPVEDNGPYQEWGEVGNPVVATGVTVTLEDADPPTDKAFYTIEVSVP